MGKYVNPGNSAFQRIVKTGKYVVTYVSRVDDYIEFLELPGGKGYAEILFFPKKKSSKPALLIELKWNHSSGGAIAQIKEKGYCDSIQNYGGDILLAGINNHPTKW